MKRSIIGLVFIALGIMSFLQGSGEVYFGLSVWPVILTLTGAALVWGSLHKGWGPSWFGIALGLWIGCIGLFTILNNAGVTTIAGATVVRLGWPILLLAIGISIIAGRGHCFGHGHWFKCGQGVGDRHYGREPWVIEGDSEFIHGVGDFVVDLTTAEFSEGLHRIKVEANIGDVTIRVPDGVDVTVDAAMSIGELNVFGEKRSGLGDLAITNSIKVPEARVQLQISARLRIGDMTVALVPGAAKISS